MSAVVQINGLTELIAHIGYPTHSFKAPLIYNPWFHSRQINAVVVPMACQAPQFPAFLRSVFLLDNVKGALITMPHKVSTLGLIDSLSTTAQIAGAVNAVKRLPDGTLHGDMFDGEGFVRGVLRKGFKPPGAGALVVGCGGVGSAIAASLAASGVSSLKLHDTNTSARDSLAQRLRSHYPALQISTENNDPQGMQLVVNATPMGMNPGDPLPMEVSRIDPTAMVGEVVMRTAMTAFLQAAAAKGCITQVGTDMLFEQIPAYLAFFGYGNSTPDELRALAKLT
jgi:shikimate dehydrogenase